MSEGYIKKMRTKLGTAKFIHPAVRIIIENARGEVLFIIRSDNGRIGLPAGAFEENETILECVRREVKEETGLVLKDVILIGISTDPARESVTYPNGDAIQYFTIEFYCTDWTGKPDVGNGKETSSSRFMSKDTALQLPENERSAFESLRYFQATGLPRVR